MTARGGVNGEAGRVKDLAVASMQGSPTVLFRIGPVMIHCGVGVAERQARYDHAVCLSEAQKWLDGQWSDRRVERQQVQLFVRLVGSSLVSRVVEAECVDFREADEEGLAVFLRELTSLIFERPRRDQQMVFYGTRCVDQGDVGCRKWCEEEISIMQKRIEV